MTEPRDPRFAERVRSSFERQRVMQLFGADLVRVDAGEVEIAFEHREDLTQQHGFVHAGVLTSIVDSACGYAALSLMAPGTGVLSVEFKVNLLAPAKGPKLTAIGRVIRSGRTISVCSGDVWSIDGEARTHCCTLQGTMMAIEGRGLVD